MSEDWQFLCTGFNIAKRRELTRKIKELGGNVITVENLKLTEKFTLICAEPKWTEKFIMACASGMWILVPEFVEDSYLSGRWLRKELYEWTIHKRSLAANGGNEIRYLLKAPRVWRRQVASSGERAFKEWRVILLAEDKQKIAAYSRMLAVGGATVFRRRDCQDQTTWKSLTHIFVDSDFSSNHSSLVNELKSHRIRILDPTFIRDFLAQFASKDSPVNARGSPELFRLRRASTSPVNVISYDCKANASTTLPKKTRKPKSFCLDGREKSPLMNGEAVVVVDKIGKNFAKTSQSLASNIGRLGDDSTCILRKSTRIKSESCVILPVESPKIVLEDIGNRVGDPAAVSKFDCLKRQRSVDESSDDCLPKKNARLTSSEKSTDDCVLSDRALVVDLEKNSVNLKPLVDRKILLTETTADDGGVRSRRSTRLVGRRQEGNADGVVGNTKRKRTSNKNVNSDAVSGGSGVQGAVIMKRLSEFAAPQGVNHSVEIVPADGSGSENVVDSQLNHSSEESSSFGNSCLADNSGIDIVHRDPAVRSTNPSCMTKLFDSPTKSNVTFVRLPTLDETQPEHVETENSSSENLCAGNDITDPSTDDVRSNGVHADDVGIVSDYQESTVQVPSGLQQFRRSVVMLLNSCFDTENDRFDNGIVFSGRMFVDAIESFLIPCCYPPVEILSTLLKLLVEECQRGDMNSGHTLTLVERILCFPTPVSSELNRVCLAAVARVCNQELKWELVETLVKNLFECSDTGEARNPNLVFLRFVVRYLEEDIKESKMKLMPTRNVRVRWCVLGCWLWTNEYVAVRSKQFAQLVQLLVTALKCSSHPDQMELVKLIQKLVAMVAEVWAFSSGCTASAADIPQNLWMVAVLVAEQLGGKEISHHELKLFFESCPVKWLSLFVCKVLLDQMNPEATMKNEAITLRTVVNYFEMRPMQEEVGSAIASASPCTVPPSSKVRNRLAASPAQSLHSPKLKQSRSKAPKDINKRNCKGESSLHVACRKNNLAVVHELLENPGIDVNLRDNAGWTPLHEACCRGNVDVVRELLSFKPKRSIQSFFTNLQNSPSKTSMRTVDLKVASVVEGRTPLHDAVINNHPDVCRLLLRHGGSELLDVLDNAGRRPVDLAITEDMKHALSNFHDSEKSMKIETNLSIPKQDFEGGDSTLEQSIVPATPVKPDVSVSNTCILSISEERCQRYFVLASNLLSVYLNLKGTNFANEDRKILDELPQHVEIFRRNVINIQNGKLFTHQAPTLLRLEALSSFLSFAK